MPKLSDTAVPSYRRHKQSGQAIVTFGGRDILLGKYGTSDSRDKYNRLIAEWLASGRRLPTDPVEITVAEIVAAFRKHADRYYRHADGTPTGEAASFDKAFAPLLKLYARTPASSFGPLKLKAVRDAMIPLKWCRTQINKHVSRIRHAFKWAVENEMIEASVCHGLQAVSGLRAGRSDAAESDPIKPVPVAQVEAVLPHVSPQVAAMIQLQLLTGMRSGEVVIARTGDIDRTSELWVYRPSQHKTQHHGHARKIYLGPKAQGIIRPFLRFDPDTYVFDPRQAEQQRRETMHEKRKTPLSYGNRPGTHRVRKPQRQAGDRYTVESYRRAISRGCDVAFPPPEHLRPAVWTDREGAQAALPRRESVASLRARPAPAQHDELAKWRKEHRWHPHQLRHTAATELRRTHGLEAAQVILGHRTLTVTQVYAERNVEAARKIMVTVG